MGCATRASWLTQNQRYFVLWSQGIIVHLAFPHCLPDRSPDRTFLCDLDYARIPSLAYQSWSGRGGTIHSWTTAWRRWSRRRESRGRISRYQEHCRSRAKNLEAAELFIYVHRYRIGQTSHRSSCTAGRVASDFARVDRYCWYHHIRSHYLHNRWYFGQRQVVGLRAERYYLHGMSLESLSSDHE